MHTSLTGATILIHNTDLLLASEAISSHNPPHFLLFFDFWVTLHHPVHGRHVKVQLFLQMLEKTAVISLNITAMCDIYLISAEPAYILAGFKK